MSKKNIEEVKKREREGEKEEEKGKRKGNRGIEMAGKEMRE